MVIGYRVEMQAALRLRNLRKSFGDKEVVRDVSLEIQPGEVFGLLGPNGAGKSTTINMVVGVSHIGSGSAEVFGHDVVKDYVSSRRLTGVMHQEVVLDVFFTIEQALSLHEGYFGAPTDPKWKKTLVEALALGPFLKMRTNQLSGGTKRRFMVAKALVHKPRLLILDEPPAGVDIEIRHNLWQFVREINQQGTTVLLTTHYLQEAEEMCGRIAIMNKGRIIALEKKDDLLAQVGGKILKLHLPKPIDAIPADMNAFNPRLTNGGKTIEVKVGGKLPAGRVLNVARRAHLEVVDVDTEAPSLEEVFLKLTQEDGR